MENYRESIDQLVEFLYSLGSLIDWIMKTFNIRRPLCNIYCYFIQIEMIINQQDCRGTQTKRKKSYHT